MSLQQSSRVSAKDSDNSPASSAIAIVPCMGHKDAGTCHAANPCKGRTRHRKMASKRVMEGFYGAQAHRAGEVEQAVPSTNRSLSVSYRQVIWRAWCFRAVGGGHHGSCPVKFAVVQAELLTLSSRLYFLSTRPLFGDTKYFYFFVPVTFIAYPGRFYGSFRPLSLVIPALSTDPLQAVAVCQGLCCALALTFT